MNDPLDNADLGDEATVSETSRIPLWQLEDDDHTYGSDRTVTRRELVYTQVVTNDNGNDELEVTVEADVMKRLPREWDRSTEPRTDTERQKERSKLWAHRAIRAVSILVPIGLMTVITNHVMGRLVGGMTINGETIEPPGVLETALVIAAISLLTLLLMSITSGVLQRKIGVSNR
ncbi:hypothetical protein C463_06532 [Halorubrum californiense DSM 19288]|uniref:Uncharacterized protein n=1 Tax=Halorubrum californiense DSM 19288 TaxID=1227465 RepID=M0EBS1_9EURY|nr:MULTISPECIES: hypothetical protein [Halorubrum]ELZ45256.1 hypothetical protein C463_06532 [Halorubrum californiense DSM 19288]TKX72112.1 hypothetical protein EXE40_05490 [Halorubrum sp. GN11GM_10-3_MGM]